MSKIWRFTRGSETPQVIVTQELSFNKGKGTYQRTIYHIDKVIRENGEPVDDGLQEIFVNTCIDDGTAIADLMRCFMQKSVHNPRFPKLSSRVSYLKEDEGGVSVMCELMEKYMSEAKEAGIREGKEAGLKEGREAGRREAISRMIEKGYDRQAILDLGYTESEYEAAAGAISG